jgi:hypothetical protein
VSITEATQFHGKIPFQIDQGMRMFVSPDSGLLKPIGIRKASLPYSVFEPFKSILANRGKRLLGFSLVYILFIDKIDQFRMSDLVYRC